MWFLYKEMLEGLEIKTAYDPERIADYTGVSVDKAAAFVDPARRYWVQSSDYGWLAGANRDGNPCILFVGEPRLASQAEHMLNFVSFDHSKLDVTTHSADIDLETSSWDDILEVADEEVGFVHVGNCPALAFVHPQMWHHAIVPFTFSDHHQITGEDPEGDKELLRSWIENESYVLNFGNAYFMNAEGDVESS